MFASSPLLCCWCERGSWIGAELADLPSAESVTCLQDRLELELPGELGNHSSWRVCAVGRCCCCPGSAVPSKA